jgi:RNA polymerase primary sigma factor
MIETIHKIAPTSRQMMLEMGREPAPEGVSERPSTLGKVHKALKIGNEPAKFVTHIGSQ